MGKDKNYEQGQCAMPEIKPFPETFFYARRTVTAIKSIWAKLADSHQTEIVTFFGDNIPEFLPIDALKVQHCLNNLVENAVKNTKNGSVKIIVTRIDLPDKNTYLALSVQDTGSGISPEHLPVLFERTTPLFCEYKPTYGVVDTGLPMTHDLMSELGGKIFVKSELGGGSTFSLLFPLGIDIQKHYPNVYEKTNTQYNSFADFNILVVDDYNLNQLTIKTLLHGQVSKVFTADHGYEALEILNSCPVDIILMDIHMPILDGIETTLKIRESDQQWADIHIVAMTADPQYQQMRLCRKIGMDATLAKPFRKGDLIHVLEQFATPYKMALAK